MSILTASQLADTHPMLPDDWRASMPAIRRDGGPWTCDAASCGGPSYLCYRCSKCGNNLCEEGSNTARQGVNR